MADMTDEEYDALDELWTKTPPEVNFSRPGVFARQRIILESLDEISASYVKAIAAGAGQTPAQVLNKIVHEKIEAGL